MPAATASLLKSCQIDVLTVERYHTIIKRQYGRRVKRKSRNCSKYRKKIRRTHKMKAHKYWSLGALACMAGCFYTGCKKLMQAHKYFACGSLVCMGMAIYSGHKIAPKRKKAEKPEK